MMYKDPLETLWLVAGKKVKEREYWLEKLSGELVRSSFPSIPEHERDGVGEGPPGKDSSTVDFRFNEELSSALMKLSTGSDIRLYILLTAVFTLVLGKYSGNSDIITAAPILKSASHKDEELINRVLILRNRLTDHMTFKEFLLQVRQTIIEADEHRNYPVEVLLKQLNLSILPFDAALLLENIHDRHYLSHVVPGIIFSFSRTNGSIKGQVEYRPSSYQQRTIERIINHCKHLIEVVFDNGEIKLSDVELLLPEERRQLLFDFNHPADLYPADKTLQELFEKQVGKNPHNIALVQSEKGPYSMRCALTYKELNQDADRLASIFMEKGVQPGTVLGIMLDRSIEMILGILSILKAGAAYLPINPKNPAARTRYMLQDCNVRLLLTTRSSGKAGEKSGSLEVETMFIEELGIRENQGGGKRASLPDKEPGVGPQPGAVAHAGHPENLAYVIYTSGSTGKPKGIPITHGNLSPLLHWGYRHLGIGPGDRAIQNLYYYFDWSVWEIFITLTSGAALYVITEEIMLNPGAEVDFILENEITLLHITPSQYQYLINVGKKLACLKYLFIGAEKLAYDLVKRSIESVADCCRVFNMYGPTEATIISAVMEIDRERVDEYRELSSVPIGKTLANTTLLVLDRYLNFCPIGVAGELYIAGDALAQGYLNNPELTAQRFISPGQGLSNAVLCDHLEQKGARLYHTGDLYRWLPDGTVEFLGRLDFQVKIRGYRIEPGEVENRLLNHPHVKEALVTARHYENGENYLCAYLVPYPGLDGRISTILREYLSAELPDYLVPSYFVILDKMPLNPNGKVDLKALPEPEIGESAVPYAAPRDEIEKRLAGVWCEVLALASSPGIDDNFFELGGNSLKATTLVYNVYKKFEVNIEIEDVFSYPSIRQLAQRLKELEGSKYVEITPLEKKEYYELSYAQRRLWVLSQFEADSTAYNMPLALTISGRFDVGAFARAVRTLVERHESLRTVFVDVDGDPHQKIIDINDFEFNLEQIDLRSLDEKAREEKARKLYLEAANKAFDLTKGPLFCFKLMGLDDEKCVLIYNIHHIVNDGWSQGTITNEIINLYNTYLRGEDNPLTPLELQYRDYTDWHNRLIETDSFAESRAYWLERFKDKPNGIELPLDHLRRAIQTFNGGKVSFTIDGQRTSKLYQISKQEDATLFMGLLTLVSVFLYRCTGQTDIIIGAPIANRKRPELSRIVGFLVNTLVYRSEINPDRSFRQQLSAVKQEALTCYQYQDYPFDLLVEQLELERDLSQSPLFNIMLAHNNAQTDDLRLALEGVTISGYKYGEEINMSKFDLIFFMDEVDDEVQTRIEYNSDLFERSTIERMADNFLTFVDQVTTDADTPVSALGIVSDEEYEKVSRCFNDTRCDFAPLTLQEIFESQVEKTPAKIAVVGIAQSEERLAQGVMSSVGGIPKITYRDLNNKSNQLALYLRNEYKIKPNDVIGVSMDRSIDMIIVLLGIIKSGAAYLAVDPTYPRDRVLHVLSDSQSSLLIIDKMRPELFEEYQGKILDVNSLCEQIKEESVQNPEVLNQPADILYVNYTSGSTGTPNGAMLSHDCLTNLIQWQNEKTTIDCAGRVLQFTSINFCVSFQEIMGTLTSGGELYLIGDIERQDIDYLMDFLGRNRIEALFLPFSYLNFLFNESSRWDQDLKHDLKHIVTAGEQLKITAGLKRFLELNPNIQLHNHYGSTEMHVVASYTLDAAGVERAPIPPIGKPISNIKLFILDEYLNVVPIGVYGELCVAGKSEILGYINNRELTNKKLINRAQLSGIKLYRSGDIGRWQPDGNIELRGRKDFMVKVRGFRVEPGEIESKILAIEKVRECVVVVREDEAGQKYLVAFAAVDNIDAGEIKRIISNELPQYMIPKIIILESLPLMPNGKVDREKLPHPKLSAKEERVVVPPGNEVERKLVEIWSQLLGLDQEHISIDDNFFELGGHSLKATAMISKIHKELDAKVELVEIFKTPTLREIASLINAIHWVCDQEGESSQKIEEVIL